MKIKPALLGAAILACALAPMAMAQTDAVKAAFATADTDHNGCVSLPEFKVWRVGRIAVEGGEKAAQLKSDPQALYARVVKRFELINVSKNGCLTPQEFSNSPQ